MNKKEVLIVSVGTGDSSRHKTIRAIEEKIESVFSSFLVRHAFTSQIAIEHIKRNDNVRIDNVKEALERAVEKGVKQLVIQPTHLMKGLGYVELTKDISGYSNEFEKVVIGEPLLSNEVDFEKVIKAVTGENAQYDDGKTAICLVGHGTETDANEVYVKLQKMLAKSGYTNYYIGTIKAAPTLADVMGAIQAREYKRIVLLPLMIAVGNHTKKDIAGEKESSWKKTFENTGYEVECMFRGLGELDAIQKLFAEHTQVAVEKLKGNENE